MKASELIQQIQALIFEHGDQEIYFENEVYGDANAITNLKYYSAAEYDGLIHDCFLIWGMDYEIID